MSRQGGELFPASGELPDAFVGVTLSIKADTDAKLAKLFPEIDRQSEYRNLDGYLWHAPRSKRPRNVKRFIWNWFLKQKRYQEKQREKGEPVIAEIMVGMSFEQREAYLKRKYGDG